MTSIRALHKGLNFLNQNSSLWRRSLSTSGTLRAEIEVSLDPSSGIRTVIMNRPEKHNALTDSMYRTMASALAEADKDDKTKLVVITGAGDKYFTSGYDLKSLIQDYENRIPAPANGASAFIQSLIQIRKPLVGVVNGSAVGIGVTLLAHCEAVFATDSATFNTPFIKLGIPPECASSYLFPKIVGHARAGDILHFNATWTAKDALDYGLLTKVFPASTFRAQAAKAVADMGQWDGKSLLKSKALLRDRERELLMKVHELENKDFDIEFIGQSALKLMSAKKKK